MNKLMTAKQTPKRGRPRGFDVDEALSVAKRLFHQRGFDGVGVAELSQAIGVTAPSLYSAFGSKCDLFGRVLEKYVAEEGGWIVTALEEGETVVLAIELLFERASEAYTVDAERPGCLVLDGTRNCTDDCARSLTAKLQRGTWELLYERIAREFPQQAAVLANYVLVILMGLSAAARDGSSREELAASGRIAAAGLSIKLAEGIGRGR